MPDRVVAVILGQMFFTSFLLFLAAGFVRDRARRRSELQLRLMDRFGSAPELLAYLESEEGRRLRDAITGRRIQAPRQVLRVIQLGLVVAATGGGLLWASFRNADRDLLTGGAVCISVGAGLLVAAVVSKQLLVRWNLWTDDTQAGAR
ncbi:MAG TPA: hypothetical protein VFQ51_06835 [Vicinamibacteria bacterium]|nr:hypothetical protein [Vicinamibacteria bacterium]